MFNWMDKEVSNYESDKYDDFLINDNTYNHDFIKNFENNFNWSKNDDVQSQDTDTFNYYSNDFRNDFINSNNRTQTQPQINQINISTLNYNDRTFSQSQRYPMSSVNNENILLNRNANNIAFNSSLRSITEIPIDYRNIFKQYSHFNYVQSKVFDDVMYSNQSLVINAPTGSGKTGILELAVVRLLILDQAKDFKIIYMAPLKALCNEKFNDWSQKFTPYNLKCIELTGDTDTYNDLSFVKSAHIICTTPEKWDFVTRRWNDRRSLIGSIKLVLIDEIHVLGENSRGATIEVVVSRMKTHALSATNNEDDENKLRFIAISATIPNINDIADWLTVDSIEPAAVYRIDDSYRPVPIKKIVLAYPCADSVSDFCFDLKLNYKLADIIEKYANEKPTLIFCSTRKSTQQAASILTKSKSFYFNPQNKEQLIKYSLKIGDPKLKETLVHGVGIHHAGLNSQDRKLIETIFLNGQLKVLLCTSTLSIGVNLPAHLVIIKSTEYYVNQAFVEYSTTQIMQMIGRAGRPQFDTSGIAVIMTKLKNKDKYELLVEGQHCIESHLHHNLIEHLNNEIVLRTVTNIQIAIQWLKSTYLYVRLKKNPSYYGAKKFSNELDIESYLENLCNRSINALIQISLVKVNENTNLMIPTSDGYLMSKYCVSYETMKLFITNLRTGEIDYKTIEDLLLLVSLSKEFEDIVLRNNEKSNLNELNKSKTQRTIRYPLNGKIKNNSMKVNVYQLIRSIFDIRINKVFPLFLRLIQAEFGSLQVNDFSLVQDTLRIFRFASKIAKCLLEYILNRVNDEMSTKYELCLNAILLTKSFSTRLWYDSPHIFRQFQRIGPATSQAFVDANYTTFEKIETLTLFELQTISNRNAQFSAEILQIIKFLPKFEINLKNYEYNCIGSGYDTRIHFEIEIVMTNYEDLKNTKGGYLGFGHQFIIIVGDENENIVNLNKINNGAFLSGSSNGLWSKDFTLYKSINGNFIHAAIISMNFIGVDQYMSFQLFESDQAEESDCQTTDTQSHQKSKRKKSQSTKEKTKSTAKKAKLTPRYDEESGIENETQVLNQPNTVKKLTKENEIKQKLKSFQFKPSVNPYEKFQIIKTTEEIVLSDNDNNSDIYDNDLSVVPFQNTQKHIKDYPKVDFNITTPLNELFADDNINSCSEPDDIDICSIVPSPKRIRYDSDSDNINIIYESKPGETLSFQNEIIEINSSEDGNETIQPIAAITASTNDNANNNSNCEFLAQSVSLYNFLKNLN